MPGLVPGIHVFSWSLLKKNVDGRAKASLRSLLGQTTMPGHDGL